jgi:hypothetical protein
MVMTQNPAAPEAEAKLHMYYFILADGSWRPRICPGC